MKDGKLLLRAASVENGLINEAGEIVHDALVKTLVTPARPQVRLKVFALSQSHWDVKDVLVMLAGNLLSDATKAVHEDLRALTLILLQA
jgi:hypothetical protein